ncbi:hypothetical protein M422DRAFT_43642 [Sphaerobolus stellatus SS14]|nr:hypothetical protein M422DRAFT_43642 [Sphaerobolus stellatus SS14]
MSTNLFPALLFTLSGPETSHRYPIGPQSTLGPSTQSSYVNYHIFICNDPNDIADFPIGTSYILLQSDLHPEDKRWDTDLVQLLNRITQLMDLKDITPVGYCVFSLYRLRSFINDDVVVKK